MLTFFDKSGVGMQSRVLIHRQISPGLKEALNLPSVVWHLVINRGFTAVSFMDGGRQVHHLEIDDIRRQKARRELHLR